MTVNIRFDLDTKDGNSTITVRSPYSDLGQTRDNLDQRLNDTANSVKALMPLRDAETGDYVFINTMKIASIEVYEVDE